MSKIIRKISSILRGRIAQPHLIVPSSKQLYSYPQLVLACKIGERMKRQEEGRKRKRYLDSRAGHNQGVLEQLRV